MYNDELNQIKRRAGLSEDSPTVYVGYHASEHNTENILRQGFKSDSGVYWFASDPYIGMDFDTTGKVVEVRLQMNNPYKWKFGDPEPDEPGIREKLINQGYDSIIAPSNVSDEDYIVFDPSQILSVRLYSGKTKESQETQVFYHVTAAKNIPSILKDGLIPSMGPRSTKYSENAAATFLFKDRAGAEDAVMGWLGDEFSPDEPLALIEVNLPDYYQRKSNAGFEIEVYHPIKPQFLKVLDKNL